MKKIINIGIVAHVDAGKTTITENLLYYSGAIKSVGRVDLGNTQTDSMELERKRGITIKSSTISFNWNNVKVNIVDTPGHVDFISEVERSLSVLDGAILVISGVEGIQSQTRILFETLKELNIPTIIFVNKLDRIGANFNKVFEDIKKNMSNKVVRLQEVYDVGSKAVYIKKLFDTCMINDDAIDVLEEENTEDFQKMAAITLNGEEYFKTSTFKHARSRILWLLFLMLSATITGKIITNYEQAFEALPVLVAFIPMIMGTGGNCGSQASTLIIRGLATNEIQPKDILKAIWKETRVAVLVGIVLSIVNGIIVMWQYNDLLLAVVVGITLICTVLLAKVLGCVLPILAKKLKLDPAIMASPLITTIVDICSVLIYFVVATSILKI